MSAHVLFGLGIKYYPFIFRKFVCMPKDYTKPQRGGVGYRWELAHRLRKLEPKQALKGRNTKLWDNLLLKIIYT